MPKWTKNKTARMRRAYIGADNPTSKPQHTGLSKVGMGELYNHVPSPKDGALMGAFASMNESTYNRIRQLMEVRCRMLEQKHRLAVKEKLTGVLLQQSKHFQLAMFWATGCNRYIFVKHSSTMGLISISKPYSNRDEAMDAYDNHGIYYLDSIRIPTQ